MVSRIDRIGNMFVKGIFLIRHARNAALGESAVAVSHGAFGDDRDFAAAFFGKHQSAGKSGKPASYDQMLKKHFLIGIHFFTPFSICAFIFHIERVNYITFGDFANF